MQLPQQLTKSCASWAPKRQGHGPWSFWCVPAVTELVDRELHTTVGRPHSLSHYHEQMARSLARGCVDATWLDCGHWMPIAARHRIAQEASVIRTELQTRPGFADCSLAALPYIDTPIFIKCTLAVSLQVAPVPLQVATGPCAIRTVPATVPASSALCSHLTQVKGGPSVPCRNNTTFPSITTTSWTSPTVSSRHRRPILTILPTRPSLPAFAFTYTTFN